ncbi:hypothetical protein [Cohnella silvisoli]|uniref:Uncharacterized protein n=1 Tax=Cohnella silvisoli TaxID=2873699 RepID=A0ABV1KW59_9BACL|nr:hypothetical protein [Cohnella silvisoli]MCD9023612.1 hypothetical protein [Cohnella silvisoli]
MEMDSVFAAGLKYTATVGPRYRALAGNDRPNDRYRRTSGRTRSSVGRRTPPSRVVPRRLTSPSSLALRDDGLFELSGSGNSQRSCSVPDTFGPSYSWIYRTIPDGVEI